MSTSTSATRCGRILTRSTCRACSAGHRSGILGYRVELVLAEEIVTALQRGTANTRWRDFVDITNLARHVLDETSPVEAIRRVAAFRQADIRPLREVLAGYPEVAQQRWAGWRRKQGLATTTPEQSRTSSTRSSDSPTRCSNEP